MPAKALQKNAEYVMGHTERERERLSLQGALLAPHTMRLFRRAGIAAGMRVLDVGCGVGEVSRLAAELVGHEGRVIAVDFDERALEMGRARAESIGLRNIDFVLGDIHTFRGASAFDAVVGRHILLHAKDPLKVLKNSYEVLRSGGVCAFHELNTSVALATYPRYRLTIATGRCYLSTYSNMRMAPLARSCRIS